MGEITVDFIAKDPWQMVLDEEGPWEDVSAHLATLQNRLYSCLDAAIDGQLAEQFPESHGQPINSCIQARVKSILQCCEVR